MPTINPAILLAVLAATLTLGTILVFRSRSRRNRLQTGAAVPAQYRDQTTSNIPPERVLHEVMGGLHPSATVTPIQVRNLMAELGMPLKIYQVRSLLDRDEEIVGQDHTPLAVSRRTPNRRRYRPAAHADLDRRFGRSA